MNNIKGKIELKQEAQIAGKPTKEITYDFSKLKGSDIQSVKKEMGADGVAMNVLEIDTDFHTYLFARAAGMPVEDIYQLGCNDYLECIGAARNFIIM